MLTASVIAGRFYRRRGEESVSETCYEVVCSLSLEATGVRSMSCSQTLPQGTESRQDILLSTIHRTSHEDH